MTTAGAASGEGGVVGSASSGSIGSSASNSNISGGERKLGLDDGYRLSTLAVAPLLSGPPAAALDSSGTPAAAAAANAAAKAADVAAAAVHFHPRSVLAFCDYWADAVLNDSLGLGEQ
jgi:hypothetical protein